MSSATLSRSPTSTAPIDVFDCDSVAQCVTGAECNYGAVLVGDCTFDVQGDVLFESLFVPPGVTITISGTQTLSVASLNVQGNLIITGTLNVQESWVIGPDAFISVTENAGNLPSVYVGQNVAFDGTLEVNYTVASSRNNKRDIITGTDSTEIPLAIDGVISTNVAQYGTFKGSFRKIQTNLISSQCFDFAEPQGVYSASSLSVAVGIARRDGLGCLDVPYSGSGLSAGAIIGIVVGVLAFGVIFVVILILHRKREIQNHAANLKNQLKEIDKEDLERATHIM